MNSLLISFRMYDLGVESGRRGAVADLSLLQSITFQNSNSVRF